MQRELLWQITVHEGGIADLTEQLLNLQGRLEHSKRKAYKAAEGHKLELLQYRAAVSKGLEEFSIKRH